MTKTMETRTNALHPVIESKEVKSLRQAKSLANKRNVSRFVFVEGDARTVYVKGGGKWFDADAL